MLWASRRAGLAASREVEAKLSMGDDNEVAIEIENRYPYPIWARVLDEAPVQFQKRDAGRVVPLAPQGREGARQRVGYTLRPVERGTYAFGTLHLYAATPLGLVLRRFRAAPEAARSRSTRPSSRCGGTRSWPRATGWRRRG